jgi:hypothetical protein
VGEEVGVDVFVLVGFGVALAVCVGWVLIVDASAESEVTGSPVTALEVSEVFCVPQELRTAAANIVEIQTDILSKRFNSTLLLIEMNIEAALPLRVLGIRSTKLCG